MGDYDIAEAFEIIEAQLIKSMVRNMARHRVEEIAEEKEWTMWQAEQLKALEKYKKVNQETFQKEFTKINDSISEVIAQARKQGKLDQEIEILEAIKNGFKPSRALSKSVRAFAEFFKLNDRKLEALINATKQDLQKAEVAMLRMANDKYRKTIFNAQVYANTGAGTYEKAVDLATKDFLASGINCIEYKNGARVNISSYADMVLRTASKRAYLVGEGEKRKEWGITTVIMNKRGAACPKCLPFVGKIFIDDVWSNGESTDGDYPLLSSAIAKGLYHPNCRDSHTTYFEGVTSPPKTMTQNDINKAVEKYRIDQKQNYCDRMVQKYKTLKEGSLDPEDIKKNVAKLREWTMRSKFSKGQTIKPIAKAVPDGIINNKEWLKSEFSTPKKFAKHIEKHLHQYKNANESDYMTIARELLAADLSPEIEGFVDNEGFIFKYNKTTNDFAIGRPDGKVSTLFKPDAKLGYWEGERIKYEPRN